jgi:hypothetical protein
VPAFPQTNFLSRIPNNATIIGEVKRFVAPRGADIKKAQIELTNGTVRLLFLLCCLMHIIILIFYTFLDQIITGLDRILFGTGYHFTFPFLPHHHNATLGTQYTDPLPEGSDSVEPIVTDGTHLRALYLDAFYIPDPTLLFINGAFHAHYRLSGI